MPESSAEDGYTLFLSIDQIWTFTGTKFYQYMSIRHRDGSLRLCAEDMRISLAHVQRKSQYKGTERKELRVPMECPIDVASVQGITLLLACMLYPRNSHVASQETSLALLHRLENVCSSLDYSLELVPRCPASTLQVRKGQIPMPAMEELLSRVPVLARTSGWGLVGGPN